MNILLIDKNLTDPVNYHKWTLLAQKPGISMSAVTLNYGIENFRKVEFQSSHQTNFPVTSLPSHWMHAENRGFYTRGLFDAIGKADPDVVICFEEPCSLYALQTLAAVRIIKPEAKLIFFSWYNLDDHKFVAYRPFFFYEGVLKLTLRAADRVLCANKDTLRFYQNRIGERAKKLYFGVNLQKFQTDHRPAPYDGNRPFRIGYIGRMLAMKDIECLIDAVAELRKKHTIELFFLGNGDHKANLQQYCIDKGINDITEFSEAVPSSEVRNYMQHLDVHVLPSKSTQFWEEQYGRILVECMTAGVPNIGSSSGAIAEVIGDAGLIFREQDTQDLELQLNKLIENPELLQQFSSIGKARAEKFSSEQFAETLFQYLHELK
ncbi:MAG: glycosyltransferase family 4 protein [Balneolales bacterium]|nr:glycosyltransferase family 4 protein [Balneolales bacterium]